MVNTWCFSGRVGADATLRTTQSGEKVLGFRVANDTGFGDRKTTQWVSCSFWGKRGEAIANYVKKGDRVTVSGELQLREFQRNDGTPGAELSVRVNDMDLGSGPREEGDRRGSQQNGGYQGGQRTSGQPRTDDWQAPPAGSRGGSQGGGGKPQFDPDLGGRNAFRFNP